MRIAFAGLLMAALVGCSGGSNSQNSGTVLAQSGYTNASLSGTYAFQLLSVYSGGGSFYNEIGTITFDGSGHITGGSGTAYFATSTTATPCVYTNFTGTYSIQTSGSGTGTLSETAPTSGSCGTGYSGLPVAFEVAASGATVEFVSATGTATFAGSATKQ